MIRFRTGHDATNPTVRGLQELSPSAMRMVNGGQPGGEECRWDGPDHHQRRGHWDDRDRRWHWDGGWC